MEEYIPYSLLCDFFSRNLDSYLYFKKCIKHGMEKINVFSKQMLVSMIHEIKRIIVYHYSFIIEVKQIASNIWFLRFVKLFKY